MKITHNKVGQNLNTSESANAEKTGKAKGAAQGDAKASILASTDLGASRVDVSEKAQQMKKAKELAKASPDVDEAKVAHFQSLIDSGKYKVSAKDIADKMVDEELSYN